MQNGINKQIGWIDDLTSRFSGLGTCRKSVESLSDSGVRSGLVARVRWLLLLFIGSYVLSAGSAFLFSKYGFFLSFQQKTILLATVVLVASYNLVFQFLHDRIRSFRFVDHLQVLLDILCVTTLIHVSGGVASWFWPVYLVITVESAFLLERKGEVWFMGALGGLFYGTLLVAEYFGLFQNVVMPFVSTALHQDHLYVLLRWLWVVILNTVTAIIMTFLMGVVRTEATLLKESEESLLSFIETANDLIFSTTPDGMVIYSNQAVSQLLAYGQGELKLLQVSQIVAPNARSTCNAAVAHALKRGSSGTIETVFTSSDGRKVPVEGSLTCSFYEKRPIAIWWICRDITDRKLVQNQLYQLAHYDSLTGLPNRALLYDRLRHARAHAHREGLSMAVIFLDLDRFKIINDTLGHPVGDKLLQSVAKRLSSCVREVDTAARIGGDEFVIILVNLRDPTDAEKIATKVLSSLASSQSIDGHELFVTTSIGISIYPRDDEDVDNLIKKADIAMYAAKSAGSNTFRFYASEMDENAHKRFVLENSLRKALDNHEFLVYYQPKVEISSGSVTAFEALLRWQHPELGLLAPGEFISLAEETGLIIPIGEWVIRQVGIQCIAWKQQGLTNPRVAVNLSGYQLQQKNFLGIVADILRETGLSPDCLEFEITETVIMQNPDFTISVLNELRDMGINISIDDFGTGYSSLSHLKRFSVNTLKIDRSFVREVESNTTDAAITSAIIAMGNSLNMRVIAEGVETKGQLDFLREKLCDEMQGYYFSRPMPPEKVIGFMAGKSMKKIEVIDESTDIP